MEVVKFVIENHAIILEAVMGLLLGVIGISLLIPGDQPEKALQGVVEVLKKISKK
jgi:hypothetical protein